MANEDQSFIESAGDYVGDLLGGVTKVANDVLNVRDRFRPREQAEQQQQVAPSIPPGQAAAAVPAATAAKKESGVTSWVSENSTGIIVGSVILLIFAVGLRATR